MRKAGRSVFDNGRFSHLTFPYQLGEKRPFPNPHLLFEVAPIFCILAIHIHVMELRSFQLIMDRDILTFIDRRAWRAWLLSHSATVSEAWLGIRKKHSPLPGLSLADAVEEALCFGWIDSTLNTLDEQSYLLRFSPRKPNSVWSLTNIHRVEELQRNGLMTQAGLAAVQAAQECGQWQAAFEREDTENIPSDLEDALQRKKGAMKAFHTFPPSKKKQYVYWLQSAKREDTRQKRIDEIVRLAMSAQ